MSTGSLEAGDKAAADVAVAPRVTLDDINAAIRGVYFIGGGELISYGWAIDAHENKAEADDEAAAALLTVCLVVMHNGFTIIGKSAPASPENYNQELGEKFALEDAKRQIWPLMGFALKDRLHREAMVLNKL